ncbi:hypothetical protein PHMEG_0006043 [Phytophthora megakarya]|uniref:Uncharacterized protein n=1 Tax=Phytophthora megakarya TaxID=4795 RepID=A0A225WRK7_9STRA|nr:hypothetical protein PHMEG_0006043 [Phytophthora megakarya]
MKLLRLLVVGALQPLGVLSLTHSLGLKDILLADSRERTISFNSLPFDLPSNMLISADAIDNGGRIPCTESESMQDNGSVAVVLAFSKCLNDSALNIVEQWVNQVKSTFANAAYADNLNITFQSTMVPGACEERSEKTKRGLQDPTMENQGGAEPTSEVPSSDEPPETVLPQDSMLLADEVYPDDLKRLEAFPGLGNVVNLADDRVSLSANPIAVVSFVTGEKSYGEVMQFEAAAHVSKTFNFQICHGGTNCNGVFEDCIRLEETVDLFMYNPFTVTRSLQCDKLDDGVPVTYLDDYGNRKCFCSCPAGYELGENDDGSSVCKKVVEDVCPCVWSLSNGFPYTVTTAVDVCSFNGVATNWGVPVPFPTDGYVADKRDNLNEGAANPRITVTAAREQVPEYKGADIRSGINPGVSFPLTFREVVGLYPGAANFNPIVAAGPKSSIYSQVTSWKDYQMNRIAHIDDIQFTSYGKYHLEVSAYDYFSGATCEGCLSIVDKYRPTATTTCPKSFCDHVADPVHCTGSAEMTTDNLNTASNLTSQYLDFAIKAQNDACSVNNRCDKKSFSRRDFFDRDYKDRDHGKALECFDKAKVIDDLLCAPKTKKNPLVASDSNCDNSAAPVKPGQCTRCCQMKTKLKEWWTDYRCGSDYDVRSCEGDFDQKCEFNQCLVMNGDTLATVTASISAAATAESKNVLAQVEDQSYQTVTQIHRALDCTSFGGKDGTCTFSAKMSELIDTTESLNVASTQSGQATDYVFWRYKAVSEGETWSLWKTGKHLVGPGHVEYDNDAVVTFSNPETKITIEAWTQCGLVRRFFFYVHLHVNSLVSVCDKFNDMWYQTSVSRLPIGNATCAYPGSDFAELTFDFHPNAGLQYSREQLKMKVSKVECFGSIEGRTPVGILTVLADSPEIVTRFGVEMLNKATTKTSTNFHVECRFTYDKYGGAKANETCKRDFAIADCKGPAFDVPNALCDYEDCAGNELAGLYEACGGIIVKADASCTTVQTGDKECCQGCGDDSEVMCTALLDLPDTNTDLKRCEPTAGAYSSYGHYYAAVLLTETARGHPAATALLVGTALIAVVALVVVRRRVVALHSAQTVDDAYYPLLH